MVSHLRLNRMLAFDEATGVLECEGGVSLGEIVYAFIPRGWFLPVVPGTRHVTVGGAIAADVHGKNHHRDGTFGRFVDEIPYEFTDIEEDTPTGPAAAATWGGGASAPEPSAAAPGSSGASFALGDDVVHAQFGEGVVVGVEPGGLVVVRFAADRSERKLMADYAPLKRR